MQTTKKSKADAFTLACALKIKVLDGKVLLQKWDFKEDLKMILSSQTLNFLLELCFKT